MSARFVVSIDTISVEGVAGVDHDRLVGAIEKELGRLVSESGVGPRLRCLDTDRVCATLPVEARDENALGRGLARIIWAQCIGAQTTLHERSS